MAKNLALLPKKVANPCPGPFGMLQVMDRNIPKQLVKRLGEEELDMGGDVKIVFFIWLEYTDYHVCYREYCLIRWLGLV